MTDKKVSQHKIIRLSILALTFILGAAAFIYLSIDYRADDYALKMLQSDELVTISETDYGWLFDGPGEDSALIFYPGAKVEPHAYAPLLHKLAARGLDVCLVDMPLELALLGINKADSVVSMYSYEHWYIGGHSMGGAMAAIYASEHPDSLDGVILFAAFPTKPLNDSMTEILLVGSNDGIIRWNKIEEGRQYAPSDYVEYVIEGGNHALFGSYGEQRGDGIASISADEQTDRSVDVIISTIFG